MPSRVSIRLRGYNYANQGYYFVTLCTHNRIPLFGSIETTKHEYNSVGATRASPDNTVQTLISTSIKLNIWGHIVKRIWYSLPDHHPVVLDTYQIMPNHIHCIIGIHQTGGSRPAPTLGTIIGSYKSECTKQLHLHGLTHISVVWQRNYYEHIIRSNQEYQTIQRYIVENPSRWRQDKENRYSEQTA